MREPRAAGPVRAAGRLAAATVIALALPGVASPHDIRSDIPESGLVLEPVGSALWRGLDDVFLLDDLAYCAQPFGLLILDVSDPAAPALVSRLYLQGRARGVTVAGGLAYVADEGAGLRIVDVTDPAEPVLVGTLGTPGRAYDVAVSGDLAFVADYESGLQIVDVTDPAAPVLRGTYDTPGYAQGVAIRGNHAFVADREWGVQVVDVSDPAAPVLAATAPGLANDLALAGNLAYVAAGLGLQILDISNPAAPFQKGFTGAVITRKIAVQDHFVFSASAGLGLQIVDVLDPANPVLITEYGLSGVSSAVAVSGDYAFVGPSQQGLEILDVGDPAVPLPVGTYPMRYTSRDVVVSGTYAYVADSYDGVRILDVSGPDPVRLGVHAGAAVELVLSNGSLYALGRTTLEILDLSDPASPVTAGSYTPADPAVGFAVAADGRTAYIAIQPYSGTRRLEVVDISKPAAPALVGSCFLPYEFYSCVAVKGDYVYVGGEYGIGGSSRLAGAGGTMQVVNVRRPSAPEWLGEVSAIGDLVSDITVAGDFAYVAEWDGLHVVDLSDPSAPVPVAFDPNGSSGTAVTVVGHHAFVTLGSGLRIFDVSDPTAPVLAAVFDMPPANDVAVFGGRAFVADAFGFLVLRISGLEPIEAQVTFAPAVLDPGANGRWVTAAVQLPAGYDRATIDPASVRLRGPAAGTGPVAVDPSAPTSTANGRILVKFDRAAVQQVVEPGMNELELDATLRTGEEVRGTGTLNVLGIPGAFAGGRGGSGGAGTSLPSTFALGAIEPNPFGPATSVRFDVPRTARVRIAVYDTRGRLVRTLVDGERAPGRHSVAWQGRDGSGRAVASGVYFVVLDSEGARVTRKVTLLR